MEAESFDTVLLMHALTYTREPARVFGEAARVLRPGGRLLAVTLQRNAPNPKLVLSSDAFGSTPTQNVGTFLQRLPGIAAALAYLLDTKPETDVFVFAGTGIPDRLLRTFGFRPDDELPLSPLASHTVLITMPMGGTDEDDPWTVEGRDVTDPANWQLSFCEQNTG